MDKNLWTTTFFYDGEQWGEGIWYFADAIADSKPSTFDPASIPNNLNGEGNEFLHAFQFDEGDFTVANAI